MKKTNLKKLNIGCGFDIKEGYVNLDSVKLKGVDIVHDLDSFPYPFKDDTFEDILCSHVLEHVSDITKVMEEIYRISKDKAKVKIMVPYFASPNAWRDPTHKRLFNYDTFSYFSESCYYNDVKMDVVKKRLIFLSSKGRFMMSSCDIVNKVINLFPVIYQRFFCYYLPFSEVHFLLEVKK